jgi:hypothetical protein
MKRRDKIEQFRLDLTVNIGYYRVMFLDFVLFILRLLLIAVVWAFVWRFVQPKSQARRLLRATLLVLALLTVLALTRVSGI